MPAKQSKRPRLAIALDGPASIEDAFLWPVDFLTQMQLHFPEQYTRLLERLRHMPLLYRSWYSGMDCPLMGLRCLEGAIALEGPAYHSMLWNQHACDIGELQRRVLLSFPPSEVADHVFGDLCARVDEGLQSELVAASDEAQTAFKTLVENGSDVALAKSMCGRKFVGRLRGLMSGVRFDPDGACWCYRHKQLCNLYPEDEDLAGLVLAVAGVTCTDVCNFGLRQGLCGKSFRPWVVWACERLQRREHIILQECAPAFPHELFVSMFSADYEIHHVNLTPSDVGWPASGLRGWTLALRRDSLTMPQPLADIMQSFTQRTRLDGGAFFCAPVEVEAAEKDAFAAKRKLPMGCSQRLPWEELLSPGDTERLASFDIARKDHAKKQSVVQPTSASCSDQSSRRAASSDEPWDKFLCDISQNAECRNMLNSLMPRLLTKSHIWNLRREVRRPLLGLEHLLAMGVPLWEFGLGTTTCPFESILGELSPLQMRLLAGNAMCIPIVGRVLGVALALAAPVPGPTRGLSPPPEDDSDDDVVLISGP